MADLKKNDNDKNDNLSESRGKEKFFFSKRAKSNIIKELAPYSSLGLQMVMTIFICAYLGWWLDGKLDTQPWLLIILTFFGAVAGMITFLKTVMTRNKKR